MPEKFGLYWLGKDAAIRLADTSAVGELLPIQEESVHFDQAENLLIEGDNLEVLKHLQATYAGKVDMIYIDPPYNTGQQFIYSDRGRTHSDWLNMLYPRLVLARRLLRDDGVLFVSINDVEVHHLRCVLDEIFGEDNYIETFLWTRTNTAPSLSTKSRKTVEYILCYEKIRNARKYLGEKLENGDAPLLNRGNGISELIFPVDSIYFQIPDGIYKKGEYERVELLEDLIVVNGKNSSPCKLRGEFKWSQNKVHEELRLGTFFLVKSLRFAIRFQRMDSDKYKSPTNELNRYIGVGTNETATAELQDLGLSGVFDYPKPVSLIKYLARFSVGKDAIILDFFAGSGTTAEAVLRLNHEDGGSRRFICVQLDEPTDPQSVAFQAGFKTISAITIERIRRVIRGTASYPGLGGAVRFYRHRIK